MAIRTTPGDVLILQTETGVRIHAVGRVSAAGQEDFYRAQPSPHYIIKYDEALAVARTLMGPSGRVFLVKIDSDTWAELASLNA